MAHVPEHIDGIGRTERAIRRNAEFEPGRHRGLSRSHRDLLDGIGAGTSVRALLEQVTMPLAEAIVHLQQLVILRAVDLGDARAASPAIETSDDALDFEIVDATDLGELRPHEVRLLEEDVDLASWEKRRVLAALRILDRGGVFELLGVDKWSSRSELKRAYYVLSKQFHPDRYYGRHLGSFGALMSRIFEIASESVRALAARSIGPTGPRRRMSERLPLELRVTVECERWSRALELVTADISDQGMFIVTSEPARRGDRVVVTIRVKRHAPLQLVGRVVSHRAADSAAGNGRSGLAIELAPPTGESEHLYRKILSLARTLRPVPTEPPALERTPRFARGTGPHDRLPSIVGIDFGTTYTAVSAAIGSRVRILPWVDGNRSIPTVVSFPRDSEPLVGARARERILTDPRHTIASTKRLLGRSPRDPNVEAILAQAPYRTAITEKDQLLVEMWGNRLAIPQLVAMVLRAAKENAERVLDIPVEQVVLTVPVSFGPRQIEAIRAAGRIAQLRVVDVIDEPSAAALANRFQPDFGGVVGVYDFGGGTFDFSVVDSSAGDFTIVDTAGDGWLGGDDFDLVLANAVANQIWRVHGVDVREREVEWQHLVFSCERAKRTLTFSSEAVVSVPELVRGNDVHIRVSRDTCERLWAPLIRRSVETALEALRRHGKRVGLDAVYLSGGVSRIPLVQRALSTCLETPVHTGVPPEFAACLGASIHAAQLDHSVSPTLRARGEK